MNKKYKLYGASDPLPYCCGVEDIGCFFKTSSTYFQIPLTSLDMSGTGLYTATFIDTEDCKLAYKELCSLKELLYQSPVKFNIHSGRNLFLCVFKDK